MNLVGYPVDCAMKAGDLCPLCKRGHLKPTDEKYRLVCDNEQCSWVERDPMAGLEHMSAEEK
jgi:hypothetical protein